MTYGNVPSAGSGMSSGGQFPEYAGGQRSGGWTEDTDGSGATKSVRREPSSDTRRHRIQLNRTKTRPFLKGLPKQNHVEPKWEDCPECGNPVRVNQLERHMRTCDAIEVR